MQFIHAADAHIDSPLRGLESFPGAPVERIRNATRDAFANLVSLALERQVAFVVLAGDLFDGPWPDMQTGLWTAGQFRRLAAADIAVYLLRGNHDAVSEVGRAMQWPENVWEFSCEQPQTFIHEETGVALHGQGFWRRDVMDDLVANYPAPLPDRFNIGVLHTSLTGDPRHDPYAPTSLPRLRQHGYQYWALGHIHQRSQPPLCNDPPILFSGNLQGRHIREPGEKGCTLVTVDGQRVTQMEFLPTDTVRWYPLTIQVDLDDCLPEIYHRVRLAWEECRATADGRLAVVRLRICGACRAHAELQTPGQRDAALAQIRDASHATEGIWTEKIEFDLTPAWNLAELRNGQDILAEILNDLQCAQQMCQADRARQSEQARPAELAPQADSTLWSGLAELEKNHALELFEAGIDLSDTETRLRWLRRAESYLAASLREHTP